MARPKAGSTPEAVDGECFDPSKPLYDARREAFTQLVFNGIPIMKAGIGAGYEPDSGTLTRVRQRQDVSLRLAWLQNEAALQAITRHAELRCQISYSKIEAMKEAEEARLRAMELGRPAAAVTAVALKSKIAGFLEDAPAASPGNKDVREMTLPELQRTLNDLRQLIADEHKTGEAPSAPRNGEGPLH